MPGLFYYLHVPAEFKKMLQDVYSLSIVGLNMDMVGIDDRVLQSLCSAAPFAPTMESDEVCIIGHVALVAQYRLLVGRVTLPAHCCLLIGRVTLDIPSTAIPVHPHVCVNIVHSPGPLAPPLQVVMQLPAFVKWVSETLPALFVGVQNNIQWSLSNLLKHAKAGYAEPLPAGDLYIV
jgi:hypothetical protein